MKRKWISEDEMRAFMGIAVEREWGTEPYRGYEFKGIGWRSGDCSFRAYAYMHNSPLHPCDMMYVDCVGVDDWKDYISYGETFVANTVLSLKRLIDKAHDDPTSFKPTKLASSHMVEYAD